MKLRIFLTIVLVFLACVGFSALRADSATAPAWCTDKSDVAILGTSADTGYATTGYTTTTDTWQHTQFGWSSEFADNLAATWSTATHNYSHNGSMASDFLPGGRWAGTTGAVADFAQYAPSMVLIDLGGNEYWSQVNPATFKTNLSTIIDNIRAQRADTVIILSIYAELKWVPNQYTTPPNSTQVYGWSAYAQAIYDTAVAKGTALVDLRQTVPAAGSTPMVSPNPWTSDNIHLNEAGNLAESGMWFRWVSAIWSVCG